MVYPLYISDNDVENYIDLLTETKKVSDLQERKRYLIKDVDMKYIYSFNRVVIFIDYFRVVLPERYK
jgi:hypothetical protein